MVKLVQRLFTFGDSYTYGDELKNPKESCYPQLVANYLDVPLTNKALLGNSNDFIMEQLLETTYDHYDLVIVCFSSITRLYFEDSHGVYTTIISTKKNPLDRDKFTDFLHTHVVDDFFYRRWLTQIIYIQEYLKSRSTRYLFANAFANEDFYPNHWKSNRSLINQIDKEKFIGWPYESFNTLTSEFPRGKFLHPLEEAHAYFANLINLKLKKLYDLPKVY